MIKIKILTVALTSALGVGGVTAASTQWHRFDGPTSDRLQAKGNNGNNGNHGNNDDGNSGKHFGTGSCGD